MTEELYAERLLYASGLCVHANIRRARMEPDGRISILDMVRTEYNNEVMDEEEVRCNVTGVIEDGRFVVTEGGGDPTWAGTFLDVPVVVSPAFVAGPGPAWGDDHPASLCDVETINAWINSKFA